MTKIHSIAVGLIAWGFGISTVCADVIIDDSTLGFYNDSIGNVLDGTSPLFPTNSDPVIDPASEPDLHAAASILGDWLTSPNSLNANWSGPQVIPATWSVTTETAIVYEFDAQAGLTDFVVSIGVDNGAFVWLDGTYVGGHLRPGGVIPGELTLTAGNVASGLHYLQVLREDHGTTDGFTIQVEAFPVPEPTPYLLFLSLLSCGRLLRHRTTRCS